MANRLLLLGIQDVVIVQEAACTLDFGFVEDLLLLIIQRLVGVEVGLILLLDLQRNAPSQLDIS